MEIGNPNRCLNVDYISEFKTFNQKTVPFLLQLFSTLPENATETENRIRKFMHFRFFPFPSSRTAIKYRVEILNFFCFSQRFSCAAANRIRLGSDRPKHKQHGVGRRYGVFYYGICLV